MSMSARIRNIQFAEARQLMFIEKRMYVFRIRRVPMGIIIVLFCFYVEWHPRAQTG